MAKKKKEQVLYRPVNVLDKHGDISIANYIRFVKQFMDPNTWGNDKKFFYRSAPMNVFGRYSQQGSRQELNRCLSYSDNFGRKLQMNAYNPRRNDFVYHLDGLSSEHYIYYTNYPLPHKKGDSYPKFFLVCIDIDPYETTTDEDIRKASNYLSHILPSHYFEKSTNKRGLHFYFLYESDNKTRMANSSEVNDILASFSYMLKLVVGSLFNCKYDGIKSNLSEYIFCDKSNSYLLSHCGSLCKLPCPQTEDEFRKLYDIKSYSFDDIRTISDSLYDTLKDITNSVYKKSSSVAVETPQFFREWLESSSYSDCDVITHKKVTIPLEPLREIINSKDKIRENDSLKSSDHIYRTINAILLRKPLSRSQKQAYRSYEDLEFLEDSFVNEREFITHYIRCMYIERQKVPPLGECYKEYLAVSSYRKNDEKRRKRFSDIYTKVKDGFKPELLGKNRMDGLFLIGDYKESLIAIFGDSEKEANKELDLFQKKIKPDRKEKVLIGDLEVATGFFFVSITKAFRIKLNYTNHAFSVATDTMVKWFNSLRSRKLIVRSCNTSKAYLMRDILIEIGWLKCTDNAYSAGQRGMRYVFTDKFPRYKEFERIVGKVNIDKELKRASRQIIDNSQ